MATFAMWQTPVEFQFKGNHIQSPNPAPRTQRPKLSLNTTTQQSYGRSSTSLRLDTALASSPTLRNTYKNALEPGPDNNMQVNPSSNACAEKERKDSGIECDSFLNKIIPQGPLADRPFAKSPQPPYTLPVEARSILTNGPLTKRPRSNLKPAIALQPSSESRHSHSAPKRVCFREPLSEEIYTTRFVKKHSDIRSRSNSPAPKTTGTKPSMPRPSLRGSPPPLKTRITSTETTPSTAEEHNEESASETSSEDDQDEAITPKTPVVGRRKKEREWVWTLGPLPGSSGPGSVSSLSPALEEDLDDSLGESLAAASAFLSKDDINAECK